MFEAVKNNANMDKTTTDTNILYGQGDSQTVTIRPNVTSWRNITINDILQVSLNMTADNNIHGLSKNDTTTTMMQNSQWGAVAYLTQSAYGNMQTESEDSGVWNNSYTEGYTYKGNNDWGVINYSTNLTGMAGSSIHITDIIRKMDKKQVQQETYMEYMIWQEEHGNMWRIQ